MEQVKVVTIPTLPKAVVPTEPPPPALKLPPVLVMTREEALYYADACDEFNPDDPDDAYTPEELRVKYPGLTKENACDWAIYGFTVQDWLTVESEMAKIAGYVEQLRAQIRFMRRLMDERQEVIDKQLESIQKISQ